MNSPEQLATESSIKQRLKTVKPSSVLAYNDYPVSSPLILDSDESFSYIRALEHIAKSEGKPQALITREPNYTRRISGLIRGVRYSFIKDHLSQDLLSQGNDIYDSIFLNICDYGRAVTWIKQVRGKFSGLIAARLHHDFYHLVRSGQPVIEFISYLDILIAPTPLAAKEIQSLFPSLQVHSLGFGVDLEFFIQGRKKENRNLDVVTSIGPHPKKAPNLWRAVCDILISKGLKVSNIQGLGKYKLREAFQNSKIFFMPSLTEASGSRVLIEAASCGCTPVALNTCRSCSELCSLMGGHVIDEPINYNYASNQAEFTNETVIKISHILLDIYQRSSRPFEFFEDSAMQSPSLNEKKESIRLSQLLTREHKIVSLMSDETRSRIVTQAMIRLREINNTHTLFKSSHEFYAYASRAICSCAGKRGYWYGLMERFKERDMIDVESVNYVIKSSGELGR